MSNQFRGFAISLGLIILLSSRVNAQGEIPVISPAGNLRCTLSNENNHLYLAVQFNGNEVIEKSPLHMSINNVDITTGVVSGESLKTSSNDSYPWYGLHSVAVNHYNGENISFRRKADKTGFNLEIRVFDDAVAFRFTLPGDSSAISNPDESTVFNISKGSTVWYHDLYMHYEGVHIKKLIDTIPEGQWAAPPLTIKLPGSIACGKEKDDKDPIVNRSANRNSPAPTRIPAGTRRTRGICKCEKRTTTQSKCE